MAVRGEPRYGGRPDESACPQHQDAHASLPMTETLRPAAPSVRARHKRVRGPAVSWIGAPEKHHPPRVACSPMNIITDVAMESERYRHAGFRSLKRSVTAAGTRTSAKPRPPCRARCDRPHRNNWELTEPELGAHLEGRDYAQSDIAGRPERM